MDGHDSNETEVAVHGLGNFTNIQNAALYAIFSVYNIFTTYLQMRKYKLCIAKQYGVFGQTLCTFFLSLSYEEEIVEQEYLDEKSSLHKKSLTIYSVKLPWTEKMKST